MKKITVIGLLILSLLMMTACSQETEAPTGSDSAEGSGESTGDADELVVAIWDNNQKDGLQEIMDDWSEESGVDVEIQVIAWDEYWTLLEAGAAGGTLPDVFWMHSNNAQKFMDNDILLDLTDRIEASETIDLGNYYSDIVDLYSLEGKQYAMPKDIDTIALWYNKTMFDEAGVAYPDDTWTWETLYETAKELTKDDGSQYGYAMNTGNNQDSYYNAIYAYDGYIINDEKTESGYDNPNTIEAMELFERMMREGLTPDLQTLSENGTDVLFNSGKVAMITQGSWMVPGFKNNEYAVEHADIAVLPMGPDGKRVSIYNGLGWAASAEGEHPESAWDLIEYLSTEDAQLKQAELGVTMSAYMGTSENWKNSSDTFNLQAYLEMLDSDLVFRPYSRNTRLWEDMATSEFRQAWTGDLSMEETCRKIAEEMNQILQEEQ